MKYWYILLTIILTACALSNDEPEIVYVTATSQDVLPSSQSTIVPTNVPSQPTPNPPRTIAEQRPDQHTVQSGDTLYGIALTYGVSLDSLLNVNEQLEDPNALEVGQEINLPAIPTQETPDIKLMPDSRMVRGPGSASFDVASFIKQQSGFIRFATDEVNNRQANGVVLPEILSAVQIVERVALEYSVDARLLLAILEYKSAWLSVTELPEDMQSYPLISEQDSQAIDREGLYRQLTWTADRLNMGYYGWKYRDWTTLEFTDGTRLLYNPGLNAGTVALQYFFSLNTTYEIWQQHVSQNGFYRTYLNYFGDPFVNAFDPIVPANIQQPDMTLPFAAGETWFYTGGWHGGWNSGSAWAAVDFAPPDDPADNPGIACYTSQYGVRAVASGVVARSNQGAVVLDLDGDGDEATGWTVFYLHLTSQDRVQVGTQVQVGDVLGRVACEGGFSTATHLHIGRRYNGEWIPADCNQQCPDFVMSGWEVVGLPNQEYQGYLEKDGVQRVADQGRQNPNNRISW